jgi:hypothetical protein
MGLFLKHSKFNGIEMKAEQRRFLRVEDQMIAWKLEILRPCGLSNFKRA